MELGIITLSDLQRDPATGRRVEPRRLADTLRYAELADTLGLDVFGVGEHHSADFAVPSPAVVLAAIATRTSSIKRGRIARPLARRAAAIANCIGLMRTLP